MNRWAMVTGARTITARMAARGREVGVAMVFEVVSMISMLIVFPLTARNLGPENYGQYTTLYVFAGLGIVWVYSGTNAAVVQLLMQVGRSSGSLVRLSRHQILVSGIVSAVIGLSVVTVIFGSGILVPAMVVFGSELILAGFAQVNVAVVLSKDGVPAATKINLVRPVLRTIGVVALALGGAVSLLTLVINNLVATAAMLVVSMVMVRRHLGGPATSPSSHRELARYSAYYSTSMSTNAIQEEGDKVMLAASRPAVELGEYMAAYRIVATLTLPFKAVGTAATRWFLPRDDRIGGQMTRTARLSVPTFMYGLVCAVAILVFGDVIGWVVGPGFDDVVLISAWLCLVPMLNGLAELPFMGLMGLGRNRERMFLGVATGAVAVVSYVVLIPTLGWPGAVIGTYISETVALVAGWMMLVRCQRRANSAMTELQAVVP